MIRDRKDLNDFVARMTAGKSAAKSARVSSNAPPSPAPMKSKNREIPQRIKAANDAEPKPSIPAPAKSKGTKPGSKGKHVTIHIHNH